MWHKVNKVKIYVRGEEKCDTSSREKKTDNGNKPIDDQDIGVS